ncbi:MAG TPA: copper transporter [Thermaerobacter sp.]
MGRRGPLGLRYHILTLCAVFLALGIGIFAGAGLLDDDAVLDRHQALIRALEQDFAALRRDTAALRAENRRLSAELARYGEAEQALASLAVEGRLAGRRVALVELGRGDADTALSLTRLLQAAGAEVAPQVQVDAGLARLDGHWRELAGAALGTPGASPEALAAELARALVATLMAPGERTGGALASLEAAGGLAWQGGEKPPDAVVLVHDQATAPEALLQPLLAALAGKGLPVAGLQPGSSGRDSVYAAMDVPVVSGRSAAGRVMLVLTLAGQRDRLAGLEGAER